MLNRISDAGKGRQPTSVFDVLMSKTKGVSNAQNADRPFTF